jgi:signal transduction histidine kinase
MVTASSRNNKQLHFEKSINIAHSLRLGDPRRTRQIIYNLLSNAFKFTGKDGTVRLDAHEDSTASDFVVIRITDTGTASIPRLLQCAFYRRSLTDR